MKQQWIFPGILYGESGKRGTVKVQRNSGHQGFHINYETQAISAGAFIYYATWYGDDGSKEKFALTREGLDALRRGKPEPAESEAKP